MAMTRYRSFPDWLLSGEPVEMALTLGAFASFVLVIFVVLRRFPLRPPFFSGYLVLALCPYICTSLLAVIRVQYFLEVEPHDSHDYLTGRLGAPVRFAIAGAWASGAALLIYSLAYGLSCRSRNVPSGRNGE